MTNMLQLPDWYQGGKTDAEDLVKSYLKRVLGPNSNVYVCTWLPANHYTLSPGEEIGGTQPTLRVWRQPGKFDPTTRRDQALVQIAAITPTRKESWQLVEFVRDVMDSDVIVKLPITLSNGDTASVSCCEEWQGPQLVPERLVDEKFIPVTFKIGLREPGDLPNYRQIIKSLPQ
jgi:hypothetical protein